MNNFGDTIGHETPDPLRLFEQIPIDAKIIVAVSGGGDSIALLLLANAWAHHVGAQVLAVTVDHGLRSEAAAEAAFVASICEGLGISHITLAWDGIKPNSGLPEAARLARYQLLEEYAVDVNVHHILTGHTADDQVETVYMRLSRENASGAGRGLSGMATSTIMAKGVTLMRPLLGITRQALRQYLLENAQSWIEDPSNEDTSYERVRARKFLETRREHKNNLFAFSKVMGRLRKLVADETALYLRENISVMPGLVYRLDLSAIEKVPQPILFHALQVILAVAGGGEYFASASKLHPLMEVLMGSREDDTRRTLANCVVELKADYILIYREARNLGSFLLGPGDSAIWDGRIRIANGSATSLYVGPLDPEFLNEVDFGGKEDGNKKINVSPRAALQSLPVLRGDGDELHFPMLLNTPLPFGISAQLTARALAKFCPDFDIALYKWLDELKILAEQSALAANKRGI